MTSIRLVVPAALRDEAGGVSVLTVPLAPAGPSTLRGALDVLAGTHPILERRLRDESGQVRRHVNLFVAGDESRTLLGQDTPVTDGVEVLVLPNVAGG